MIGERKSLSTLAAAAVLASAAPAQVGGGHNLYPRWSPDGQRIVFHSTRDGNEEIYVMNADGSAQRRLTNNLHSDRHASWTPDGKQIVFQSMRGDSYAGRLESDIYIMADDGSNQRALIASAGPDITPRISPDGRWLAWVNGSNRNFTLMVANADGSSPRALDVVPSDVGNPTWAPNNEWIYFDTAAPLPPKYDIRAVKADGSAFKDLTRGQSRAFYPSASPDGKQVAFGIASGPNGEEWNIAVAGADGSRPVIIVDSPGYDGWPEWSPDGHRIAFASRRGGSMQIYTINADGTGLKRITGQ